MKLEECCGATNVRRTNVAEQRMPEANVQARMLRSNESLRGMLRECLRRFLLKQNQKEKQNECTGKSLID
jgi:hypothetical protein